MFTIEPVETAPVLALPPQDMDTPLNELRAYDAIYSPLLQRREQRECSEKYMHGLWLELLRQPIDPMALTLEGANRNTVRAMQRFLYWTMIQAVHQAGRLRCRWVACDEAFGRNTVLVDNMDDLQLWYDAEVPHDTRVWQGHLGHPRAGMVTLWAPANPCADCEKYHRTPVRGADRRGLPGLCLVAARH